MAAATVLVSTVVAQAAVFDPSGYTSTARSVVSGYAGSETLKNFPVLIKLGTNLPGYR